MIAYTNSPNIKGVLASTPSREQLVAAYAPCCASLTDLVAFGIQLMTTAEFEALRQYARFFEFVSLDTVRPAPGRLTTREQMMIAEFRQHTPEQKAAMMSMLALIDHVDAVWYGKVGAS